VLHRKRSWNPGMLRSVVGGAVEDLRHTWRRASGRLRRRAVMARMRPTDIVLASPRTSRLSPTALLYRLLLRSRYVHAMLYIGGGEVIHTTARRGVTVDPLPRKLFDRQHYRIYRVLSLTDEQRQRVVVEAKKLLDWRLDYFALVTNIPARWLGRPHPLLRLEKNRLWCSKLIHLAFARAGIELLPGEQVGTVTSEDLGRSPVLESL